MKKLFFIVILFCFTSINLHSQWSKKETGFNKRFICSALLDTNTCYLAGDNEVLLKTTDSGNSWNSGSILTRFDTFHSLFFVDKMHGWGVTYAYDQYNNRTAIAMTDKNCVIYMGMAENLGQTVQGFIVNVTDCSRDIQWIGSAVTPTVINQTIACSSLCQDCWKVVPHFNGTQTLMEKYQSGSRPATH